MYHGFAQISSWYFNNFKLTLMVGDLVNHTGVDWIIVLYTFLPFAEVSSAMIICRTNGVI